MPDQGRDSTVPTADQPHRRTVLVVIVVSQVLVAVLTAVAVIVGYRHLDGNIEVGPEIDHVAQEPNDSGPDQPLNVLVMGSDTRDGTGNDIDGLTGGGQRADTTILIHVSADRREAYGVSLPRDAMVARPACEGRDGGRIPAEDAAMFNTAYALGGELCTVRMVEHLTGIYIDHYVTIDFNGFVGMVDAVHGVEVCIPKEVDDPAHDIYLEEGTQELDGREALNYVRERYVLSPNSDIGRMKRQQAFIASMVNRVFDANTLARFDRVYQFLDAATRSIRTDPELNSVGKLTRLAREFRHTGLDKINFVTVPIEPYPADPNRLQFAPGAEALWERIRDDEPLGRQFGRDAISADDEVGTPSSGSSSSGADAEQRLANGLCA